MLTGAMAKEQIRDRIAAADAHRMARGVAGRERRVRTAGRTLGSGLAAIVRATGRSRPEPGRRAGTSTA